MTTEDKAQARDDRLQRNAEYLCHCPTCNAWGHDGYGELCDICIDHAEALGLPS